MGIYEDTSLPTHADLDDLATSCPHMLQSTQLSTEFARKFYEHPAALDDPSLALTSARESVVENHLGDEFEFRDDELSVFVYAGAGCGECAFR